ncbi:MAG: DinB family protein [Anaerolineales bacterium]|nr:DinB family protein [Anaerolineales bacterium]
MKELLEYREKLIARLSEATKEFCEVCENFANPFEKVDGDWNVHQIASHTRDVEHLIYGARVRQTLNEDNPYFKSFDADVWMTNHYDKDEPLHKILIDFDTNVTEMCNILNELPQTGWSRLSRHESGGNELTLQIWVERSLAHIEEHLKALKTIK